MKYGIIDKYMSLVTNKKIHLEYSILRKMTFGVELLGAEVKSLRGNLGRLDGARVVVSDGELKLVGSYIPIFQPKNNPNIDAERVRKLLATKAEILEIGNLHHGQNLQIFPISFYTKGKLIKLECGVGKRFKKADKREVIRKKDSKKSGVDE